ncbi:uncharacterized protein VTP21DRAFT_1469 [Calcarisporiella thermophila]|uniref:uncharacterized protein n=1 Tax=Calcarisporiella thermophila TaxID=911321 RepID=UPI0037443390
MRPLSFHSQTQQDDHPSHRYALEQGIVPGTELFVYRQEEADQEAELEAAWDSESPKFQTLGSAERSDKTLVGRKSMHEEANEVSDSDARTVSSRTQAEGSIPIALPTPPDGGYGWVVVASTFVVNFTVFGIMYSWGIYQELYLTKVFKGQYSTLTVSFIGSLGSSLLFSLGTFIPPLVSRIGTRGTMVIGMLLTTISQILASFATELWHIFLTQGFLFGVGASLIWFPAVICPQQWFQKHRGVAIGISIAGGGIGGLALSPLVNTVILRYDYRWSLRVLGLLALVLLSLATIFTKPFYKTSGSHKHAKANPFDFKILTPKLRLLMLCGFFITFGYLAPFFMLNTYAKFIGVNPSLAATSTGIMSGVNSLARILIGLTADHFGRINVMFICTLLAGAVTMIVWPLAKSFEVMMVFVVFYGFFGGGFISLYPAVIADLVPPKDIADAVGMIYFVNLFGNLFGTPIAGALFDITGRTSFVPLAEFCGGLTLFSSIFILILRIWIDRNPLKKI